MADDEREIDAGPVPDANLPLTMAPADDCERMCSKCDEAWYLAGTPSESGFTNHLGYIRAGNSRSRNEGLAAAILHRVNNWDAAMARIAELEAEVQRLRRPRCVECGSTEIDDSTVGPTVFMVHRSYCPQLLPAQVQP